MSFFSFDRGNNSNSGSGTFWNYSNPDKEGYTPILMGRVVELADPPKTVFGSGQIDRWKDGNAKRNIRLTIQDGAGNDYMWEFGPGSKAKPSLAMAACAQALQQAGIQATGLEDLLGLVITVTTQEPPQGFAYGANAPRPWTVQIMGPEKGEHRGTKHIPDPGEEAAQPAPNTGFAPAQAPVPNQVYAAAQNAANAMGYNTGFPAARL